jgi:hypothetical protein
MTDKALRAELRDRIYEAAQTLRRLPDRESSLLRAGERCAWPTIILSYWEAYGQNAPRMRLPAPSATQISEMEEVLGWITWLGKQDRLTMRCVWVCCAENRAPSQAVAILGLHRKLIRGRRDRGLDLIARQFLGVTQNA